MQSQYLPAPDEQRWLLDELTTLIRRRGYSTFVSAPVLEPRPEHFPEGTTEATRRLLVYADLPPGRVALEAGYGPAALAVARAFRRQHELEDDPGREEPLVWLTAVYLGFGVLLAGEHGPLSNEGLAFVIAAQQVVRAPLPEERARFAGLLGPELAERFAASYEALAAIDLVKRLGLPRSIVWPAPRHPTPTPLPSPAEAESAALPRGRNHGVAVFRVTEDPSRRFALFGVAVGVLASMALVRLFAVPLPYLLWLVVACTCAGWWFGSSRRRDRCSEPECGWTIPPGMKRCLGCDGAVNGRIRHERERLAARARLARRDAARR
jgi:hypothetical protein